MNKRRLLALLICAAMIILTLTGCGNSKPENKTDTPPDELTLSGEEVTDVTAITGSTDENGNVIEEISGMLSIVAFPAILNGSVFSDLKVFAKFKIES